MSNGASVARVRTTIRSWEVEKVPLLTAHRDRQGTGIADRWHKLGLGPGGQSKTSAEGAVQKKAASGWGQAILLGRGRIDYTALVEVMSIIPARQGGVICSRQ